MIDSYLLEQLLAFYEEGTLSAAADKLLISQPAISQSMKKIEDTLGVPLFNRSKNKTTFNDNGLLLVDYAKRVVALQFEMIETVRHQASHQKELHLAAIAPAPLAIITRSLATLSPQVALFSKLLNDEANMLADLQVDSYDVVITRNIPDAKNLTALPFFTETLHMIIPTNHPLARFDQLTFKDLEGQNILLLSEIGFWMEEVKSHLPKANFLYMDNSKAFTNLAMFGDFPTFGSDFVTTAVPDNRKVIPLVEATATAHFYFVTKTENLYKWQKIIQLISEEKEE